VNLRHPSLGSFLQTLRRERELHVIDEAVSPNLVLAEIHRRTVSAAGPALLFTRVDGSRFPVVTNLFGTRRRIDLAFGDDPAKFIRSIVEAAASSMPPKLSTLWRHRSLLKSVPQLGLRPRRSGPVMQHALPQVTELPQVTSWPRDGGAFITLPLVYTEDPETGKGNLGMYRLQIYDERTTGMHFQIHRGIGFHYHIAERLNQALPANVCIGGPPALIMAAIAPLPENVPELVFASLLQGGRLAVVRNGSTNGLPVAAEAEFALIGRVPPRIRRREGPFGDHYGYYAQQHDFPLFQIDRIYHRSNAVYPATIVGRPRQEDHYIGEYLQELFSPIFPLIMNGVVSVWAYDDAGVHPLAAAVVKERYRKEAFMAALRILGEGQLSLTKFLIVTDSPLPLHDFRRVLVHVLERADFASDLTVFSDVAQDTLDYTSGMFNVGSKAILMGLGDKRFPLHTDLVCELRDSAFRRQAMFAPGVLVVEGPPWRENDDAVQKLLLEDAVRPFRLVCLVDDAAECTRDEASFLWTVFTRFEPAADIHAKEACVRRFHVRLSAPVVFDCRMKPWYPPPVEADPNTIAQVDKLWPKIFPRANP
jgi:UbiD family decarboxylase